MRPLRSAAVSCTNVMIAWQATISQYDTHRAIATPYIRSLHALDCTQCERDGQNSACCLSRTNSSPAAPLKTTLAHITARTLHRIASHHVKSHKARLQTIPVHTTQHLQHNMTQ